jgi:hypothetical protein
VRIRAVTHLLERALEEPEPLSILELEGPVRSYGATRTFPEHVARERDPWDD